MTTGAGELLQLFREGGPLTRADLVADTGLSRTTVGLRLDALLASGVVGAAGDAGSSGGRPPSRFAFRPDARLILGVDLGATHHTMAVADLSGRILASSRHHRPIADGPEPVLAEIATTAMTLLHDIGRSASELAAVGIGLPGPVEFASGRAVQPPIMPGWDGFDVRGWSMSVFGAHTLVDNDVNLSAVGERALAYPQVEDLIYVKAATGIGAGIVSGGHLQRGAQGTAGDIGHLRIARGDGIRCVCGNDGCLEALAGANALLRARPGFASAGELVAAAARGETEARAALDQAGRDIGEALAACVVLMNPSVIVVGGSLAAAGPALLEGLEQTVRRRALPLAGSALTIAVSLAGGDAALLGAITAARETVLSPEGVETILLGDTTTRVATG